MNNTAWNLAGEQISVVYFEPYYCFKVFPRIHHIHAGRYVSYAWYRYQ